MKYIKYEIKENGIALVTISRAQVLNVLNEEVLDELDDVFYKIASSGLRVAILTGEGKKAFAAGADIRGMLSFSREQSLAFSQKGNAVFRRIEQLDVPVIAAIHGFALGGGCELALCCDIRLAAHNAVFAQPETSLGIIPGYGGTQRLARIVGVGNAKEMVYTGRKVDAAEAKEMGLVNHVYSSEELMPQALELARKIAQNAPIAVRAAKEAIVCGLDMDITDGISLEAHLFSTCFETADQQNAMSAFIHKKECPVFQNK